MKFKNNKKIILFALLVALGQAGYSQGFVNLDFEDATIPPTPAGGSVYPADPAQCFPGWTVGGGGGSVSTIVIYNNGSIGSPAVELMGPNFPNFPGYTPLQGSYSAALYYDYGTTLLPPTLSQTGLVPADAQSINFLVGNGMTDAAISMNGVNISLQPVLGGRLAGDISAFAGSVVTLTFSVTPNPPGVSRLYFDDIQFSSSSVPEPSVLGLLALGGLLFVLRREGAQGNSKNTK